MVRHSPTSSVTGVLRAAVIGLGPVTYRTQKLDIGQDVSAASGNRHYMVQLKVPDDAERAVDAAIALTLKERNKLRHRNKVRLKVQISAPCVVEDVRHRHPTLDGAEPVIHSESVSLVPDTVNVGHR